MGGASSLMGSSDGVPKGEAEGDETQRGSRWLGPRPRHS